MQQLINNLNKENNQQQCSMAKRIYEKQWRMQSELLWKKVHERCYCKHENALYLVFQTNAYNLRQLAIRCFDGYMFSIMHLRHVFPST